ncbi:MAG: hypothetical protein AAGI69_01525 [Cyanobacteria bacterium P01_H01_bin.21]
MAKAILSTVLGALMTSAAVIGVTAQSANAQGFTGSFAPEEWQLFNSRPAFSGIDNSRIGIGQTSDGSIGPILDGGIPLAPFNGSVDFTDTSDGLTLLGSDQSAILEEFGLTCNSAPSNLLFLCGSSFTTVYVTVPEAVEISFSWDYMTTDSFGPAIDPFGFAIGNFPPDAPNTDGVFTELIDRDGAASQSGTTSVELAANQIFGFQIGTADNQGGRAQVNINDFSVMVIDPDVIDPKPVPEPASAIAIALFAGLGLYFGKKSHSDS